MQPTGPASFSPYTPSVSDDAAEPCSICLEAIEPEKILALDCNHSYHRDCIQKWVETKPECCLCRAPIPEANTLGLKVPRHPPGTGPQLAELPALVRALLNARLTDGLPGFPVAALPPSMAASVILAFAEMQRARGASIRIANILEHSIQPLDADGQPQTLPIARVFRMVFRMVFPVQSDAAAPAQEQQNEQSEAPQTED